MNSKSDYNVSSVMSQQFSDNENTEKNIDVIRKVLGDGGKWQLRTIFLVYLFKIPSAWYMACVIFTAQSPWFHEYMCKPSDVSATINVNETVDWNNVVSPVVVDYHKQYVDVCQIYNDAEERWTMYKNSTAPVEKLMNKRSAVAVEDAVPCYNFEFHSAFETVVSKFGLVCSRNWLVNLTQSFHLLGVFIGVLVTHELLKNHSPKFVMQLGMVLQIIFGVLTGQVPYIFHAFLRTADATCCVLMYGSGALVFSDITDGKWRLVSKTLFELFWSTGLLLLPIIGYVFKDWTNIYYAISIPTLLLLPLQFFMPESPYWLLKRGYLAETKQVLLDAANYNKTLDRIPKDLDDQLQRQMHQLMNEQDRSEWLQIWENKRTILNLISVHMSQTLSIILYYAILLNISVYGREYLYVNTIVAGVFEILGAFIGYIFVTYTKKSKWQWTGLLNIAGGLLFFTTWIYHFDESNSLEMALLVSTSMLAKTSISCSLAVMAGCTAELVTGNKKPTAVHSVTVFSRCILIFGPFIGATWFNLGRMAPPSLMGGLTILNGIFSLSILPKQITSNKTHIIIENGRSSPQEIQSIENQTI